jgi:Txe/YoeB family toxin of Txe-Axe toxin-antitoxin module
MVLSEYEAKRAELDKKMEELNEMESEKKIELSIKYQADCKKIQAQIGQLKHKQKELLKQYQNDKAWFHQKFRKEKADVTSRMHTLRLEYLTVNGIESKETSQAEKKNEV